ncbi:acyl-CoA carboxylase subunit epsilon [Streptomyces sp. enrichment culture]|uniref:acyl-CoA carboxylase subunit epsilon n=1 Tax=Streptomyces sp. enrichment culture TaxID=1795815 RepID=UPI003F5560C0
MESTETVLRVERGQADGDELAALTTVLLILRARGQAEPQQPPTLGWSWWKQTKGYAAPGSWR